MKDNPPCHFLVLDDDEDEAFLIKRAFIKAKSPVTAFICRNVPEVKAYLSGGGMYANRERFPIPQGILSDLHLPEEDGFELLHWVREQPEWHKIPFIVLTGSASPREIDQAVKLGASSVVLKPSTLPELTQLIEDFARDWRDPFLSRQPQSVA